MRAVSLQRHRQADTVEALFRAEYVGMVRLAYALLGDMADAEEVVQDTASVTSSSDLTSFTLRAGTCERRSCRGAVRSFGAVG